MKQNFIKFEKKKFLLLAIIMLSVFVFANTTGVTASGFAEFTKYLNSFLGMIKWVGGIIAFIYVIWKAVELMTNFQFAEFMKAVVAFAIILAIVFGGDKIINALGGTEISPSYQTSRGEDKLTLGIERYMLLGETLSLWKKAFYSILIICFLLTGTSIYLFVNRSEVKSYLIKVNNDGELIGSEKLNTQVKNVGKIEIEYFAKKFIKDIRTITLDKKVFDKALSESTYFLTTEVKNKIQNQFALEKVNEFIAAGKTRDVEIVSFTSIPETEDTYQVRWKEKEYDSNGALVARKNMNSIMKFKNFTPNESQMQFNPFGILITDMNINQES